MTCTDLYWLLSLGKDFPLIPLKSWILCILDSQCFEKRKKNTAPHPNVCVCVCLCVLATHALRLCFLSKWHQPRPEREYCFRPTWRWWLWFVHVCCIRTLPGIHCDGQCCYFCVQKHVTAIELRPIACIKLKVIHQLRWTTCVCFRKLIGTCQMGG